MSWLLLVASTPVFAQDFDGDDFVGAYDLSTLLGSWGECEGCPADLDGDGFVGASDLSMLLGSWGQVPALEIALTQGAERRINVSETASFAITSNRDLSVNHSDGLPRYTVQWTMADADDPDGGQVLDDGTHPIGVVQGASTPLLNIHNTVPQQPRWTSSHHIVGVTVIDEATGRSDQLEIDLELSYHADAAGVDNSVFASAEVDLSRPAVRLKIPQIERASDFSFQRKPLSSLDAGDWQSVEMTLVASDNDFWWYEDDSVVLGEAYEYEIVGETDNPAWRPRLGYVAAAVGTEAVDHRGPAVLVIEEGFLAAEPALVAGFEADLSADGWEVTTLTAPRHDPDFPVSCDQLDGVERCGGQAFWLKEAVLRPVLETADEPGVVVVLGRVPVPYSGWSIPDGHFFRALPTDQYYGELAMDWTDESQDRTIASEGDPVRHDNVPGDGKFDPSSLTEVPEWVVGRIDMANLGSFAEVGESDLEAEYRLLERYLERVAAMRRGQLDIPDLALVSDNFRGYAGDPGGTGWRTFAGLVGPERIIDLRAELTTVARDNRFLALHASGAGSYQGVGGGLSTQQAVNNPYNAMFSSLYGSYFADWDSPDAILRALLAADGLGLVTTWAGRERYTTYVHHLGMGLPYAWSHRASISSIRGLNPLYLAPYDDDIDGDTWDQRTGALFSTILLGDPTVRLGVLPPVEQLEVTPQGAAASLSWQSSLLQAEYRVYRSSGTNSWELAGVTDETSWIDTSPGQATHYKVVQTKLGSGPSGVYTQQSLGAIALR